MTRRIGTVWVIAAAGALVLAGCGSSDDDAESGGEPAAEPAAESDSESADADAADDVEGAGSNDEAQEALDDAGVDMDLDELEETARGFSTGEGGGVVTIAGEAYTFEATGVCIVQGTDFVAEGPGTAPDGTPAWVGISHSLEDFDGDGEEAASIDVSVEVGKTELFGSGADDQPDWSASYNDMFAGAGDPVTAELSGDTIRGGGPISDYNGIAIPFGETAEMTFEANCS